MAVFPYEIETMTKLREEFLNSPEYKNHYSKLIDMFNRKNGNNYYSAKDLQLISDPQLDYVHCAIIFKNFVELYAFDYKQEKFIKDGRPIDYSWYEFVTGQMAQVNRR